MGREVEAHTASKAVHELFLLTLSEFLVLVEHKLKLDDFLGLELVLHQVPESDTTITGDRVEAEVLGVFVLCVPSDLPDGVSVLASTHSRLVNWLVVRLQADIEHHDGTIVATDSEEGWGSRVEINAHYTRLSGECVLGPGGVLDGEAANKTGSLPQEIVTTVGDREQIVVTGVPGHGGNVLAARLLGGEAPKGQDRAERLRSSVVGFVLVVFVVAELLVFGVLDKHALHNLECTLHAGGVERVLNLNLNDLGLVLVLATLFGLLFGFSALNVLKGAHVSIKDHPLGGLHGEGRGLWRVSLDTLLSHGEVEGLGGTLLVEELVTERLFAGAFILIVYNLKS